ncbi:hypothetical protein ACOBQB_33005 [Streptomyces sp. G5(2025)]|uniref:hypothetical protein n=1 Tax=Streptomyces sp. G5(2025) TaxID=3406628 RepID=UPI003C26AB1A
MNADKPKGPEGAPGRASPLELLAEAVRADAAGAAGTVDAEAQREAVAAFRAARDAGAHRARTRRRDDWRPRERRRPARISLKAAGGVVLAGGLLGGVALAAAGTVTDDPAPRERPRPAPSSPHTPGTPGTPGTTPGHTMSAPPGPEGGGKGGKGSEGDKDGVTPSRSQDKPKPVKPPQERKPPKPPEKPERPGEGKPKPPGHGNGKPGKPPGKPERPGQGKPKPPGHGNGKPPKPPGKPENPGKPGGEGRGGHQDGRAKGRPHHGQQGPHH